MRLRRILRQWARRQRQDERHQPVRIFRTGDVVGDQSDRGLAARGLPWLVASLQGLFPGVKHKLAFVLVEKRISTRFFLPSREHVTNPPPGTVVDSEVTRPERYDFFLVSQSVRQGTAAPTHYNAIYDTTGLKPDHMQRLAYKLTHLYFNWPGTIRVPAPCQYAQKLAFLAGQSLHAEHNARLSSTLFYL
ncbi:piwi-like protein 1 [Amblyomma americanum]